MKTHRFFLPGAFAVFTLALCSITACTPAQTPQPIALTLTSTSQPTATPTPKPTINPELLPTAQPLTLVWQGEFSADAALGSPSDIVVDADGNVYVSTQSKLYIKKFNNQGKLVTQWGSLGTGPGQFDITTGIAVDQQGNVYVDDFNNERVQKFDSTGKFLLEWPLHPKISPASIGLDGQGNVYVSIFNTSVDHIQKFDSTGKFITSWAPGGSKDGQISGRTEDMFVDKDGNVYISDPFNHRIQKFDTNGNLLAKFGGQASRKGYGLFDDPHGVAVDSQGNVFILDSYFLQKLDANGNFLAQWPVSGDLDRAGFISIDSQDNLYIFAHGDVISPLGDKFNLFVVKKLRQP